MPAKKKRAAEEEWEFSLASPTASETELHATLDALMNRDYQLAAQRIGHTVDERCHWLLERFVTQDPADLSTGERVTLRDNLFAFAVGLGATWQTFSSKDPLAHDQAAQRSLWLEVVALTRAHRKPVVLPEAKAVLEGKKNSGPYTRLAVARQADGLAPMVLLAAAELLARCERLRECPECHLLFVAQRRQERHPTCARRARDSRRPNRQPANQKRPKKTS